MSLQLVRNEGFPLQWGLYPHSLQSSTYIAPIREVFPHRLSKIERSPALPLCSAFYLFWAFISDTFIFLLHTPPPCPWPHESRYFVLFAALSPVQCLVLCPAHSANKDLWCVWRILKKMQIIKFCLYGSLCKQKLIFFSFFGLSEVKVLFFNWSIVDLQCC